MLKIKASKGQNLLCYDSHSHRKIRETRKNAELKSQKKKKKKEILSKLVTSVNNSGGNKAK